MLPRILRRDTTANGGQGADSACAARPDGADFVHGARRPRFSSVQVNIANPSTGCQKLIDIEDERKLYVRNRWTRLRRRGMARLGSAR